MWSSPTIHTLVKICLNKLLALLISSVVSSQLKLQLDGSLTAPILRAPAVLIIGVNHYDYADDDVEDGVLGSIMIFFTCNPASRAM